MTNKEYAEALFKLALIYEQNPDLKLPYEGVDVPMWVFTWNAEDFARAVAIFGNGNKRFDDDAIMFLPDIGGLQIQVRCQREQICEARVVGKRHVPEKVIPAKPAEIIPAHEEDIIEWDCKPILAKRAGAAVEIPRSLEAPAAVAELEIPF